MAGEQYGMNMPYQPPQGYGMNYYQPQQPQAMQQYQSQMEARLKGLEQRLYGQPNQQQPQAPQPQMNQPTQSAPAALFMVSTLDEAQNYAPDFNGTRQVFYIESEPDKLGMKQFNVGTGAADFSLYEKVKPQDATSAAEQAQTEPEQESEGYLTDKDIQPLRCQISGLTAMCDEIKEMLEEMKNAKLPSAGADDGEKQPADGTDRSADTRMEPDGSEPTGDHKQSAAAKPRKPNAATTARQKPSGD